MPSAGDVLDFFKTLVLPITGFLFTVFLLYYFWPFIKTNFKLFLRWGFFLVIINLFFTLLSFIIYHFYIGGAYIVSHFITQTTLNIIHMSSLGLILYFIYNFMYKE